MGSTCLVNKTNKTEVIMKIHKPRDNTSPFFNKDWFYLRQIKSKQKIFFLFTIVLSVTLKNQ